MTAGQPGEGGMMTTLLALVVLALALASITEGIGAAIAPRVVVAASSRRRGWGSAALLMALTIASACGLAWLQQAQ